MYCTFEANRPRTDYCRCRCDTDQINSSLVHNWAERGVHKACWSGAVASEVDVLDHVELTCSTLSRLSWRPPHILVRAQPCRLALRLRRPRLFSQDQRRNTLRLANAPPVPVPQSTTSHLAAAACNSLGKPASGLLRQQLYRVSLQEWFCVWKAVRREEPGPPRNIGLQFLDKIRKFHGWPKPNLVIQCTMPWSDSSHTKPVLRSALQALIQEAAFRGLSLMLPPLRALRVRFCYTHAVTLRQLLRNAPSFYKRLSDSSPWACTCHLHPHLPRVHSPDGRLHVFAPQECWPWPLALEHCKHLPAHTALVPSQKRMSSLCLKLLQRITCKVGVQLPIAFLEQMAHSMAQDLSPPLSGGMSSALGEEAVRQVALGMRGLVIEEFQKTRHVLVAECPTRVWLLSRRSRWRRPQLPMFS